MSSVPSPAVRPKHELTGRVGLWGCLIVNTRRHVHRFRCAYYIVAVSVAAVVFQFAVGDLLRRAVDWAFGGV